MKKAKKHVRRGKPYPKPNCQHEARSWSVNSIGFFQWDCLGWGEFNTY